MGKRLTYEEKLEIFMKKLNDRYPDYRIAENSSFEGNNEWILLEHFPTGEIWKTKPRYLDGKRQASGVRRMIQKKNKKHTGGSRLSHDKFIERFYDKYSRDEYEILSEYQTMKDPVKIKHLKCGKINSPLPTNLLNGNKSGCKFCYGKYKRSVKEYQELFNINHLSEYTVGSIYSKDKHIYGIITHNDEFCDNHTFNIRISDMLSSHNQRCPKCNFLKKESYPVIEIKKLLNDYNIPFQQEVILEGLVYKANLRVDFYLPNQDIYIEYDGAQHFSPFAGDMEGFMNTQKRDQIKNEYFSQNNLTLHRINYKENHIERIKEILNIKINSSVIKKPD